MTTKDIRIALVCVLATASILLTSCGGGSGNSTTPPASLTPRFSSTPGSAATEGSAYLYQVAATDPAGGAVTLALTTAPSGATLMGNTISWTPTPSQSRQANNFVLTATTSKGGSATQSWTVTPTGTVHVSWIDTTWSEVGSSATPFDWSGLTVPAAALVLQSDGTARTLTGAGGADGKMTIANVPAGYYWLRLSPAELYWTDSSTVDLGADYNVPRGILLGGDSVTTTLNVNVIGIEPVLGGFLRIDLDPNFSLTSTLLSSGTSLNYSVPVTSPADWTKIKTGRGLEYKPVTFGTIAGSALGPAALLANLALVNGATNDIDVPLAPSPLKSVNLNIKGSAWQPLFAHVGPAAATMVSTPFNLSVDPNVPLSANRFVFAGRSIRLLQPNLISSGIFDGGLGNFAGSTIPTFTSRCGGMLMLPSSPMLAHPPLISTDLNAGTVEYGDPFPVEWTRYFSICQQATVDLPSADGTTTQQFWVSNGATVAIPTATVEPMIGPVENPTINDQNIFTAATVPGKEFTLKWSKPTLGSPTGYLVRVMTPSSRNGVSTYITAANLVTSKTTLPLPPDLLQPGKTYIFLITAVIDGRANVELSPRRTGVPMANADVISAPITIGAQ